MARTVFKKLIGTYGSPFDRPLFGLASCLFLPAWTIFWRPITDCNRSDFSTLAAFLRPQVILGFVLVAVCFTFVVAYFFILPSHVFGTANYRVLKEQPKLKIITGFPYGIVRHPAAAGFLWLFWSLPSYSTSHIFYAALWSVFIVIGTLFEESGLKGSDEFVRVTIFRIY
jgi:methanethiol S-methyltransferase